MAHDPVRDIPVLALMQMQRQIALTGTMPIMRMDGQMTDKAQEVTPAMRYDALKYLLDKAIPNAKAADPAPPVDVTKVEPKDFRKMSYEELKGYQEEATRALAGRTAGSAGLDGSGAAER